MKTCSRCELNKPASEFRKDSSRKDGLYVYCKDCCKKVSHKRYRERHAPAVAKRSKERDTLHRERINSIKAQNGCNRCDENDHRCLDFHHIDPTTKVFVIGNNIKRSWVVLEQEIEKCEILCANCHRKHHN